MDKPASHGKVKSTVLYSIAVMSTSIVPVITLPIFSRVLSREDFGIIALSDAYAVLVAGIAFLGSGIAFDRNFFAYGNDTLKISQLLYSILLFVFFNFFLLLTCTMVWGGQLAHIVFRIDGQRDILTIGLCGTFFAQLFDLFLSYFKNRREPHTYLRYSLVNSGLYLCLSLALVLAIKTGVRGVLWARFISVLLITVFIGIKIIRQCPFSFNWAVLKDAWRISLPLTPRIFLGVIGTRIDKYMINIWGSLAGVGVYSIGQKIAYFVFAFQNALENVFQPQAFKDMFDDPQKAKLKLGEYLMPFFYFAGAFAVLVSLFSREAIYLLLPASYVGACDIIILFSSYYLILFFSKMSSLQLIYQKKTHLTAVLLIISYVLNIVLNYFLIHQWGTIGAAIATLITGVVTTLAAFLMAQHYFGIQWPQTKIMWIFLVFFFCNASALFLGHIPLSWVVSFMIKVGLALLYVLLGWKLSMFRSLSFLRRIS